MNVLLALLFVGLVAAGGGEDYRQVKNWMTIKAETDCFGPENARIWVAKMRRAVAECSETDAPELELPPFRKPYTFINTLLDYANQMDAREALTIYNVMQEMRQQYGGGFDSSNHHRYQSDDDEARPYMKPALEKLMKSVMSKSSSMYDNMDSMMDSMMYNNMFPARNIEVGQYGKQKENVDMDSLVRMVESALKEKEMMEKMMMYKQQSSDSYNPFKSNSYRFKREAMDNGKKGRVPPSGRNDAVTLPADITNADKLKEKLEQIQEQREAVFGNMTCVLRKMEVLNSRNELDFSLQRRSLDAYSMPDRWLKARVVNDLRVCNLVAEALPAEADNYHNEADSNVSRIKAFLKCKKMRMFKTCMAKDMKEFMETYYGRLEDLVRDTQLEEDDLLSLMYQLMHNNDDNKYDLY